MTRKVGSVVREGGLDRGFGLYLREISKIPLLTPEEEKALARRARGGDREALQKLIESNLRFVIKLAKKYQKSGLPLQDLINQGNLGLIEAARRFDPERNVKFTSYAAWWIRQAILHYLSQASQAFRMSPKSANILYRVSKVLAKRTDVEPLGLEELAHEVGASVKDLNTALAAIAGTISIDQPVDEEGEVSLGDMLEQKIIPSAETVAVMEHLKDKLRKSLRILSPTERKVIELRFGLEDSTSRTLKEVGDRMNLSRERIRQIEAQALNKLRRSSTTSSLATYLN